MQFMTKITVIICVLPLLAGCGAGLSAFNKAQKLEKQRNLDEAVIRYAEAAAENPDVGEYRVRFLKVSEEAARVHFKKGEGYLAEKKYDDALREFQTAYALSPSYERAAQMTEQAQKLRNSLIYFKEGEEFEKNRKIREAFRAYQKALEYDPDNGDAQDAVDRLLKNRKPKLEGYELNLKSAKPITLKFKDAKIKEIFNILTQLSGINFIFDEGLKDVNVSIFLENATFQQALEILTNINKLGKKVLNESTIIIYPRTPDKTKQYEELVVQTFQLNKLDAKKAVNLIRTMLQVKKIYVNEDTNSLVIRDTPEAIDIAAKILEANDIPDAEVVLDVEVVEIAKNNEEKFGFLLSNYALQAAAAPVGSSSFLSDTLVPPTSASTTVNGTAQPQSNTSVTNLFNLFRWHNFNTFLTVPNATFNFAKTMSNGETLANPKIRVKNREKSKFNVGTRVPITTTSSPSGGGISVNVQYVDVGVKVNAEPTIQLNDDVNIKLSLEVSSILSRETVGGTTAPTTVVTIGTRNLDTVLSLKDGETSIIGGLIQDNKTNSKQKVFLLGDIPILGQLFTNTDNTKNKTELVLAITPRIIRGITVPEAEISRFWSGKEDEPTTARPFAPSEKELDIAPEQPATPAAATPEEPAPLKPAGRPRPSRSGLRTGAAPPTVPTPASAPAVAGTAGAPAPQAEPAPATPAAPAPATPAAPAPAPSAPVTPTAPAPQAEPAPATPAAPAPAAPASVAPAAAKHAAPVPASQSSPISLNFAAPASVKADERFNVEISASNVTNLYSAPFIMSYDPAILDFDSAVEGPFLKRDGNPTVFQTVGTQKGGQVTVNLSRTGNVGGVDGSGTLVVASFKAKSKGSAKLGFSTVYFTAPGGKPLNVIPFNTVVEVK
jgi:general secretion pathway protein D